MSFSNGLIERQRVTSEILRGNALPGLLRLLESLHAEQLEQARRCPPGFESWKSRGLSVFQTCSSFSFSPQRQGL